MATIKEFVEANRPATGFDGEMKNLTQGYHCVEEVKAIYDSWYKNFEAKRQLIPLYAIKALFVCAQVCVAQCLMEQALIASKKIAALPENAADALFYKGKVAAARYYLRNILPQAFLTTELIKSEEDTVLTCPEEALVVN